MVSLRKKIPIIIVITVLCFSVIVIYSVTDKSREFVIDDFIFVPYFLILYGIPYFIIGTAKIPEFVSGILGIENSELQQSTSNPDILALFLILILLCWIVPIVMFLITKTMQTGNRALYIIIGFFSLLAAYMAVVGNQPYD